MGKAPLAEDEDHILRLVALPFSGLSHPNYRAVTGKMAGMNVERAIKFAMGAFFFFHGQKYIPTVSNPKYDPAVPVSRFGRYAMAPIPLRILAAPFYGGRPCDARPSDWPFKIPELAYIYIHLQAYT
jgi:hypothetical protein